MSNFKRVIVTHYKSGLILLVSFSIFTHAYLVSHHEQGKDIQLVQKEKKAIQENVPTSSPPQTMVAVVTKNHRTYVSLYAFKESFGFKHTYNTLDRTHTVVYQGVEYRFTEGVPVLFRNGIADSLDEPIVEQEKVLFTVEDWKKYFGLSLHKEGKQLAVTVSSVDVPSKETLTKEEVEKRLANPSIPVRGAKFPTYSGQLPGSPREYRNGYHEGVDWYTGGTGVSITKATLVYPVYKGKIVRIDKGYVEMEEPYREQILDISAHTEKTPDYILDKLRGRQIWIQSDNGVLVRYAHLSQVNETLHVGQIVDSTVAIAHAGNSGTSNGAKGTDDDVHPHTDLLVNGKLFYEYYPTLNEGIASLKKLFQ